MQGVAPQNRHVASLTKEFLFVHWDRKKPLLLGYSGGPDSKALLYALLECDARPHLAHVDHGWREESRAEAEECRAEAIKLGLPFHTIRLDIPKKEDAARIARFSFFQSLYRTGPFQALLLAHQADDLAETVLKRTLEGAHLAFLGGMEAASRQFGMAVWRPLLKARRSEIELYLKERGLSPISDPSNFDLKYLRSRMRLQIFPFLNQCFGKETIENLSLLSERAAELKKYLDQKTASVKIHEGPWGLFVDLEGLERIEQRHVLQKLSHFPRCSLETILNWIDKGTRSNRLELKDKKIFVDQKRVWLFSSPQKI